jgi:hypothetical protein
MMAATSTARRRVLGMLLLAVLLPLAGCAGDTYLMKELPYAAPTPPTQDQTLIYVLREDSAVGAARKLAIIDNDTVVAVLTTGTFSHFTVPSGEHEIVGYVSPSPVMHYRVTPAPGQTVYLLCRIGYTSGVFMEVIDEALAKAYLSKFKYTEIEVKGAKAKMDYKAYYDKLYK